MEISLLLLIIILVLLAPTAYAAIIGAPFVATSKTRIKEIIRIAEIKPGDNFYELGAGTGKMMIAISKISKANVIGFELSPIFYFIALLNLKINRIKNSKLYFKNFYKANLKKADIVYFFLMPKTMERLKEKFEKELSPETKIISYAFEIDGWKPYAIIKDNKKPSVYFYKKPPRKS